MKRNVLEPGAEETIVKREAKEKVRRKRKNRLKHKMNRKSRQNHVANVETVKGSEVVAEKKVVVEVDKQIVEGEEEAEVVVRKMVKKLKLADKGRKTRVATTHGKERRLVMVLATENRQTETPNLLVPSKVINSMTERGRKTLELLDREEEAKMVKVSQEAKGGLTVETEAAEEVEEAAAEAGEAPTARESCPF